MTEQTMTVSELKAHPAAALFPLLEGEAFAALVEDIRKAGRVREPVWLIKSQAGEWLVLDGRNRIAAAQAAGVASSDYEAFEGDDAAALAFVLSKNLARRHLNESQRALAVAKVTVKLGSKSEFAALHKNCPPISQADAAKMAAVSPRTMADAAKVLRYGTPEQIAEIETGKCSVSQQATLIKDKAHASRKAEALAQEQEKIAAYFAEHPDAAPAEAADGPATAEGTETAEPATNAVGEAPEADADPTPVAEMEADAKPVKTKAKKAKAEPKQTAKQREEENRKLAFTQEATAREARQAREAGDKALALIAAHMPGDAIEALHPLMRDAGHPGGWLSFLAGLAKLKPSHNGNSNDERAHLRAEIDRLRQQVALLQGDAEQQEAAE